MAIDKKVALGVLTFILMASGVVYMVFDDEGLKMRIDEDKSTFYTLEDSRWKVSGREYNKLFDGSTQLYRDAKNIYVKTYLDEVNNITKIERYTPYIRGPVILDTYIFDGNIDDVELFPISHTVTVINGSDYFYRYEVRDLIYNGDTEKLSVTEMDFGRKMTVEWQDDFRWAWVYKSGILKVQYDIPSDYEVYEVRLFDPDQTVLTGTSRYFFEGWETNAIDSDYWTVYGSNQYNWTAVNNTAVRTGSYSLEMYSSTSGNYVLNEIITAYDFTGASNIVLDFYEYSSNDEDDAASDHTDHENADGYYFTCDGSYWYVLGSLTATPVWTNYNANISNDPDFCSEINSSFAIKLTQYDNYDLTSDGRMFDDINITWDVLPTILQDPDTENLKDNFVLNGSFADTNYGSLEYTSVGWSNDGRESRGFIMYNISPIPVVSDYEVSSALLYLNVTVNNFEVADSAQLYANYKRNSYWNESTMTWNNQVTGFSHAGNTTVSDTTGWKSIDVTEAVALAYSLGDSNLSFMMNASKTYASGDSDYLRFNLKEASADYRPYLEVYTEYVAPANPGITSVELEPASANINDDLVAYITTTDANYDWLQSKCLLIVDSVQQDIIITTDIVPNVRHEMFTIPAWFTESGDSIVLSCSISDDDGDNYYDATSSNTVNIPTFYLEIEGSSADVDAELGTLLDITYGSSGATEYCIDIPHPDYGTNYSCNTSIETFTLDINYFRTDVLNDTNTEYNLSYTTAGNETVYIDAHIKDYVHSLQFDLIGYDDDGNYPAGVKVYIGDTLTNNVGLVMDSEENSIPLFYDGESSVETIITTEGYTVASYLKVPKTANVTSAIMNVEGTHIEYTEDIYSDEEFHMSRNNENSWYDARNATTASYMRAGSTQTGYMTSGYVSYNGYGLWSVSRAGYRYDTSFIDDSDTISFAKLYNRVAANYGGLQGLFNASYGLEMSTSSYSQDVGTHLDEVAPSSNTWFNITDYSIIERDGYTDLMVRNEYDYDDDSTWAVEETFTFAGISVAWIGNSNAAYKSRLRLTRNNTPTDVWVEVGTLDGDYEFNYTGDYTTDTTMDDFATQMNDYLDTCTEDSDGYCLVPIYIYSANLGNMTLDALEVNYTYSVNPINVSTSVVETYFDNNQSTTVIPITLYSGTDTSILEIQNIKYDYYGGNETYEINVHTTTYSDEDKLNITYFYSEYDLDLPSKIYYLDFYPWSTDAKNVTPFGQNDQTPILNVTGENYGGKTLDFLMYLNKSEIYNCTNITVSNTNNKSDGELLETALSSEYQTITYDEDGDWFDATNETVANNLYGNTGFYYVNYTKPERAESAIWLVKHGNLGPYNITLPKYCFDYDDNQIMLRMSSTTTGVSQPYCYGGVWEKIGNATTAALDAAPVNIGDFHGWVNDSDWGTGEKYIGTVIGIWGTNGSVADHGMLYEEAMYWVQTEWKTIKTDVDYDDNFGVWMWTDYECNLGYGVFSPELYFRGCCDSCYCDSTLS
ncbi:DNRLRE domain-containing protein [Oceanihabitans sediminis]|uniref:DNRLRE domain-containing protein n=1 Tax=Oceanihabitans sediminis TaxID=1812012 RepID=UPI00299EDD37|nr:DNRLRE domain-containing protein [Oceanihabitans sediminis]MDX1278568.1 DNRLRE domain-containing protein [Oceanihabitans sediminis]